MNFRKPFEPAETSTIELAGDIRDLPRGGAVFRQDENADSEIGVTEFGSVLRRVTGNSRREIDALIGELQTLRERLETDSKRLQSDISEYASLSQQVMQLTKIISESVRKLPDVQQPGLGSSASAGSTASQ